ncbi:hypothetical protein ACE193_14900 [Bernardetia sp. OM2101]|uniref:hypothetical protein n=1 Tax=Bernardetia sp. OM2101 TaxID=3344876 RepID=UPI0035CEFF4F
MTRQQQLIEWTESIIKTTQKWKDKKIKIQVSLTDRDFDRHGSSFISFSMIFKSFYIRTSGVRMMFGGTNNELVEVSTDFLIQVESTENQIICTEKLGENDLKQPIFRKTTLILL